jgi:hypothetical protein
MHNKYMKWVTFPLHFKLQLVQKRGCTTYTLDLAAQCLRLALGNEDQKARRITPLQSLTV